MAFLFRSVFQAAIVMLFISLIAFTVQKNLGDPLRELVGQSVSEAEREVLREEMGLNDPAPVQYVRFMKQVLFEGGPTSYFYKRPCFHVIADKFQATLELVMCATLLMLLISIPAGVYCAIKPRSFSSRMIMSVSIIGISIPVFLTAIFLIYYFTVQHPWFPSFGRGEELVTIGPEGFSWKTGLLSGDGLAHLLLPSVALASIMLPLFIRLIRAEMSDVMTRDFIRTARAKGVRRRSIWFVHALKNTLLPVLSVGGVQIGTMLAYTILTESVFQWPGMGFTFLEAVTRADTPLITSFLMVVGLIFVTTNILVDLLYRLVNPTIQLDDDTGGQAA
jgi:peptide/nickel transport system permease protein